MVASTAQSRHNTITKIHVVFPLCRCFFVLVVVETTTIIGGYRYYDGRNTVRKRQEEKGYGKEMMKRVI